MNERIGKETNLSLQQNVFLGTKKDMEDVVAAIIKIQKNADKLVKV